MHFLNNSDLSPQGFEKVVDKLLDTPCTSPTQSLPSPCLSQGMANEAGSSLKRQHTWENAKVFKGTAFNNHLGNVLVTVSDKKVGKDTNADGIADYYDADVESARDYYPFGMTQPGREYTSNSYRYGFNRKEDDKNWVVKYVQDYGFRLYNPAIGRWLSIDPLMKKYPEQSTYNYVKNNPIYWIDKDGRDLWLGGD